MEAPIYNDLVKKIIEKEQRDEANAKKLKECEALIKTEEENIKRLQSLKRKFKEDIDSKLLENSKVIIKREILHQQHLIWTDLLENTQNDLKQEEAKLEALQQSVFSNRLSFCDNTKDIIEKLDLLEATHGFYKQNYSPTKPNKVYKQEETEETEEYNNRYETKIQLEEELEKLKYKEAQIEEAKQLKLKLHAEPSSGEHFLRLQKSIKDIKEELSNLETQIRIVKDDIAKKELMLLNRDNIKAAEYQAHSDKSKVSEDVQSKHTESFVQQGRSVDSSSKTVHLSRYTNVLSSNKGHSSLRRELSQQLASKLDEEMKGILFKKS